MINGPDSKYMMQWRGEWRAVVTMFDHSNVATTLVSRCAKAVLYVADDYWVACAVVNSGDIVERVDRDPNVRDWDYIDS